MLQVFAFLFNGFAINRMNDCRLKPKIASQRFSNFLTVSSICVCVVSLDVLI